MIQPPLCDICGRKNVSIEATTEVTDTFEGFKYGIIFHYHEECLMNANNILKLGNAVQKAFIYKKQELKNLKAGPELSPEAKENDNMPE